MKRFQTFLKEDKSSKDSAGYLGPEYGPFECEHCQHFNGKDACELVEGKIAPQGCCNLFKKDD